MTRSPRGAAPLLASLALLAAAAGSPGAANAQAPQGGIVREGAAGIAGSGDRTVIRQTSERAIIDWQRFDVGRGHLVEFDQPDARSATLNRVTGGDLSRIEGRITAPGTVVIQNEAGILFTRDARIETGGLLATAGRVDPATFAATGSFRIEGGGREGARVVNRGVLTVGEAGLAALVGRSVENSGTITARRGTAALAAGHRTTIDLAGDGLVRLTVDEPAPDARIEQSGTIEVGDGRIVMTTGAASRALDGVINTSGVLRAGGGAAGGGITIEGGTVRIGGTVAAADGGSIAVAGQEITLGSEARIDASGSGGGGRVRIGGDLAGTGPMPRAARLAMEAGATIRADGGSARGGAVVLWSDDATRIDGHISAVGAQGGGFVETSSAGRLEVGQGALVRVGPGGRWLLDPRDVVIGTAGTAPGSGTVVPPAGTLPFTISAVALQGTLDAGGDVTVTTAPVGSPMVGTITVASPIQWSGAGNLALVADGNIVIASAVRSLGAGGFTADAQGGIRVGASVTASGSGSVGLIARGTDITVGGPDAPRDIAISTAGGDLDLRANKGSILLRREGADAAATVRLHAGTGATTLTAGSAIVLGGGALPGQWARIGGAGSASAIRLVAPRVAVQGGAAADTAAEVVAGAGGSLDVLARDLIEVRSAADQALLQTLDGAPLSLRAPSQVWAGPVRSGTGSADGGDVAIGGTVAAPVAPVFALAPGRSFAFEPSAPRRPSAYASDLPLTVTTSGTGTVSIGAPVAASRLLLVSEESVALGPQGRLAASAPGDAIVVAAGRRFANAAGSAPFAPGDPDARWLLYVDAFDGIDGAGPGTEGFDLYNRPFGDPGSRPELVPYGGNRIVWGAQPTLRLVGETSSKPAGTPAAPGFRAIGLRAGDALADALVDLPTVASGGAPAGAAPGTYDTIVSASASEQGYRVVLEPGLLTVLPPPAGPGDDPGQTPGGGPVAPPPGGSPGGGPVVPPPGSGPGLPPGGAPGVPPPGGGGAVLPVALGAALPPVRRGIEPLTPGDASFRTTVAEAPPALSDPFALTYSLGALTTFVDPGTADPQRGFVPAAAGAAPASSGFVPAAGGLEAGSAGGAEGAGASARCRGTVRMGQADGCARSDTREDYWTTRSGDVR